MKKVFEEVDSLDKRCYEEYFMSEDILVEHAGLALKSVIKDDMQSIMILCGPGNNGADGIALGRLLQYEKDVKLLLPLGVNSPMAKKQFKIAQALGIEVITKVEHCDVVIDALFGSGLNRDVSKEIQALIDEVNTLDAFKIACDIPTNMLFYADITVSMGALKEKLFFDNAKDIVGDIVVANLGLSKNKYEVDTKTFLLQESDLKLPLREKQNVHKGTFGHLCVVAGKKPGAAIICAKAGFAFGSGLVSIVENENYTIPYEIMSSTTIPETTTAICVGMGLGNIFDREYLLSFLAYHDKPVVVDADLFYRKMLARVLESKKELVLTPHPKEFCSLLKLTNIADISIEVLQANRFKYVRAFCAKYKDVVLLLKGANTLIGQNENLYIQPLGSSVLSKGGSGDVLSGLIGALLAQGRDTLDATINASLAHTLSAKNFQKNSYALTPSDLIEGVKFV